MLYCSLRFFSPHEAYEECRENKYERINGILEMRRQYFLILAVLFLLKHLNRITNDHLFLYIICGIYDIYPTDYIRDYNPY